MRRQFAIDNRQCRRDRRVHVSIEQIVGVLVIVTAHADGVETHVEAHHIPRLDLMLLAQRNDAVDNGMVVTTAGIGFEVDIFYLIALAQLRDEALPVDLESRRFAENIQATHATPASPNRQSRRSDDPETRV